MERAMASYDALKQAAPKRKAARLSELKGTESLLETLGGDAYVVAYTGEDWSRWDALKTISPSGQIMGQDRAELNQFMGVLRQGPTTDDPQVFPSSREAADWIKKNLSPHVVSKVVLISDRLSGWEGGRWDPFGPDAEPERPDSVGGVSDDWEDA